MFTKFDKAMMDTAYIWANLSHAKKKKVGCILAKDDRIIGHGFNGVCRELNDNCCEDEKGKTKPTVLHSESNAIAYCARAGISTKGTTAYITCTPCAQCASLLISSGIVRVIYSEEYTSGSFGSGREVLEKANIEVLKI